MAFSNSTNPFSIPCAIINPAIKAPHALKGSKIHDGADALSVIYANFSRGILSLSKTGLYKVPTVSIEILLSTNITNPVKKAISSTRMRLVLLLLASDFSRTESKIFMNPITPPDL